MEFEWDETKNQSNQLKHSISFEEATEIFRYPMYEIVYTERESRIRIVSARRASKKERELYYEYCT